MQRIEYHLQIHVDRVFLPGNEVSEVGLHFLIPFHGIHQTGNANVIDLRHRIRAEATLIGLVHLGKWAEQANYVDHPRFLEDDCKRSQQGDENAAEA